MLRGKLPGHIPGSSYSGDKQGSVVSRMLILSTCTLNMRG